MFQFDCLIQGTLRKGTLRICLVNLKETLTDALRRHAMDPIGAIALGRAFAGVALLGSALKEKNSYLKAEFVGDGPLKGVVAEYIGPSALRGYVGNLNTIVDGQIPHSVAQALGQGNLVIKRSVGTQGEFYESITNFADGEISSDFAKYLLESEQIPSALSLGVKIDPVSGEILSCGGVLIQRLGNSEVTEEELLKVEEELKSVSISEELASGKPLEALFARLAGEPVEVNHLSKKKMVFSCLCNVNKMKKIFSNLPADEVKSIREEQNGVVQIICHFCNTTYVF
jgi:molecular chaperone Hsp33